MLEDNVWSESGVIYRPNNTTQNTPKLPPGIYEYKSSPMGWWLEKTSERFNFPYKIYGHQGDITDRIQRAWDNVSSNLGVLLNGVKGTGKTVSAQLVCNWAIDRGIPVLSVPHPVPLATILSKVSQPIVVIFDEFEKTHRQPEDQEALLTTLDGMGRSEFKRLFILTTNSKTVDENFIDRPSRIRYCWEFGRLAGNVIEEIMDDMLDPKLAEHRSAINVYLNTRKVLSIDVAKTVITEVNIFRQPPEEFASMMNLSEMPARGFTLELLTPDGAPQLLTAYFSLNKNQSSRLQGTLTTSGQKEYVESVSSYGQHTMYIDNSSNRGITLIRPTEDPNEWVCHVRVKTYDTWVSKFSKVREHVYNEAMWLDKKPKNWKIPAWARKLQKDEELNEDEWAQFYAWRDAETVYGSEENAEFLVRITPNLEMPSYNMNAF